MSFFDGADFHSFLFCWNGTSLYKCYYGNMLRAFCLGLRGPEAHRILTDQLDATRFGNAEFNPTAQQIFRSMEPMCTGRALRLLQSLPSRQRAYHIWHHTDGETPASVDLHGYIKARCSGNNSATLRMFSRGTSDCHRPGTSGVLVQTLADYPPAPEYRALYIGEAHHIEARNEVEVNDIDVNNVIEEESHSDNSDDSFIDLESLLGLSSGYQSDEYPWERDSDTSERRRRFIDQFDGKPIISRAHDDTVDDYMSARGGAAVDNRLVNVLDEGGSISDRSETEVENGEDINIDRHPDVNIPFPLDAIGEMSRFDRVRMWLEDSENDASDINDSNSDTNIFQSRKRKLTGEGLRRACQSRSASNVFDKESEIPFKRQRLFHREKTQDMLEIILKHEAEAGCSNSGNSGLDAPSSAGCKRNAVCDTSYDIDRDNVNVQGDRVPPKRRRLIRYD